MAQQLEFFEIPSPCRGICQADERFGWMKLSDPQKRDVLRLCRQRFLRQRRNDNAEQINSPEQPSLF